MLQAYLIDVRRLTEAGTLGRTPAAGAGKLRSALEHYGPQILGASTYM